MTPNKAKKIILTRAEGTNHWEVDFDCEILRRDITKIQRSIMVEFSRAQRRYRLQRIDERNKETKKIAAAQSQTEDTPITTPNKKDDKSYGTVYNPTR